MAIDTEDSFIPECEGDGNYSPVQCFERSGLSKQCWCVDAKGEEIGGSRTTHGNIPVCEKSENEGKPMFCFEGLSIINIT